ncbi:MAG: hypothetical protein QM651_03275 [Rhodoblastus sp.]
MRDTPSVKPDAAGSTPYFDFMLTAEGAALKELVADVAAILETRSERQRARKATDAANFLRGVDALVSNLVASVLERDGGPTSLSLNKNHRQWRGWRYNSHGIKCDSFLASVVAANGEFLSLTKSTLHGVASTIEPAQAFVAEVRARGIALSDLGVRREAELIAFTQKQRKENAWRWDDQTETVFVDYRDTRFTIAARAQMQALKEHIAAASIEFMDDGEHPRVDTKRRDLQRRFIVPPRIEGKALRTNPFGHQLEGGRMAGNACWLTLRKDRRRASLRIDGEPIAEVDFNAMFPRLACAKAEHPARSNGGSAQSGEASDFYAPIEAAILKRAPWGHPEGLRGGVKQAVSALLFMPTLRRWPDAIRKRLPKGFSVAEMREAVAEVYPALWHHIDAASGPEKRAIGYRLMRIESDIIVRACLELAAQGITALPIHDAVLVARSKAMIAAGVLERVAEEVAGVVVPVSVWAGEA